MSLNLVDRISTIKSQYENLKNDTLKQNKEFVKLKLLIVKKKFKYKLGSEGLTTIITRHKDENQEGKAKIRKDLLL